MSLSTGPVRTDDLLTPALVLPLLTQKGNEVAWIAFKHIPYRGLDRVQVIGIWVAPSLQRQGVGRRLILELVALHRSGSVLVDPDAYTRDGQIFWPKMIAEGYAESI